MADFDQILDSCIERLEMGDSVEAILRDYPQESADLAPLLHMARTVRSVPLPASVAQSKLGMERMLAKVDGQKTAVIPAAPSRGWLRTLGDFFAGPVPRIGFAVLFFAVIGLWAMSLRGNPEDDFASGFTPVPEVAVVTTDAATPTAVQVTQTTAPTQTFLPTQTPFVITQVVTQVVINEVLVTAVAPPTEPPVVVVPTESVAVATSVPPTAAPLPTNTAVPMATTQPTEIATETAVPSNTPTAMPSYTPLPPTVTSTATPAPTWTPIAPTAIADFANCNYQWFFSPTPEACPAFDIVTTNMALQQFEGGFMQWIQEEDKIYVFIHSADQPERYEFVDNWEADMPLSGDETFDPPADAPEGWQQPLRGFGLIWRTEAVMKEKLGFAIQGDEGYVGQYQFSADNQRRYTDLSDGNLVVHDGETWSFFETDQ